MGSKDVLGQIKISPTDVATVKANASLEVSIENPSKKTVAYKLKTTRPASVKPEKTFGMVKKGAQAKVKFHFKPAADEKPFLSEDRITIVINVMPDNFKTAEKFWKSAKAMTDAKRIVLKLEEAGKKAAAAKKKKVKKADKEEEEVAEEEEKVPSEESETGGGGGEEGEEGE